MFMETWSISIILLIITYVVLHGNISSKILIKSVFPTTFSNNWYVTCYLLFYPIHPILNDIINRMDQRKLFRSTAVLVVLYIFMDFLKTE